MLDVLGRQLNNAIKKLLRYPSVDEAAVSEVLRDIQRALLQADVDVELVFNLSKRVKEKALRGDIPPSINRRSYTIATIYRELVNLLGGRNKKREFYAEKIMLVGIQGSGKTTAAAKLAHYFRSKGYKPALICADTYRPMAYEQLKQLVTDIGVEVYGAPNTRDAVKIAEDGVKYFSSLGFKPIIIDTAGRHRDEVALLNEAKVMAERVKPDVVMLVVDATIGQEASRQAKAFNQFTGVKSIFITKLDGTAKGGGAISAVAATGASIDFIGIGERISDIEAFDPEGFVSRLLGMGDIKGLIQKIEELEVRPDKDVMERIVRGKFTLYDLLEQLTAMSRLGPFKRIVDFLPGFKYSLPEEAEKEMQQNLEKWRVIMQSMTREELENPEIIDRSRIKRIAFGSGTTVKDVRSLLKQYRQTKKMIRMFTRRKGVKRGKVPFDIRNIGF